MYGITNEMIKLSGMKQKYHLSTSQKMGKVIENEKAEVLWGFRIQINICHQHSRLNYY